MAARDNSERVLLLFDIDGTLLVGASQAHAQAVHRALTDVYDVEHPAAARVQAAGRTDMEIARAILLRSGVSADRIDAHADDFRDACCEEYARLCPGSLADCLVPGMAQLLEVLDHAPGAILALVTGNLEPVARLKLARAGIGHRFPTGQGAFGSDSEDRTELPAIARARAGVNGSPHPRERTLVIGDTPRDIACARADGVRCIAVTTGPYPASELTGADAVAGSVAELGALLARALERDAAASGGADS
jgi:phosphoglycolate phosphatase-like HAD superfamily hydrolase